MRGKILRPQQPFFLAGDEHEENRTASFLVRLLSERAISSSTAQPEALSMAPL